MIIKSFTKYHLGRVTCPKCHETLAPLLPQFEGRLRYYCRKCEEEIIDFPWARDTTYPQDESGFSPSNLEGFR